jgi:signal transduction histidine kinase/CheY-like chemotaxis protein
MSFFETSNFPARWYCGDWSTGLGYLHILSDLATWAAYMAIPIVLVYFIWRRKDLPFPNIFWLFGLFIFACGSVHLIEAIIFWWPIYPLSGVVKLITALASWGTVFALVIVMPRALQLPGLARVNAELAREVEQRTRAEEALRQAKDAAEEANRAKSRFLANMSHELRTPLNAIIGYSEMLAEEAEETDPGQLRKDLDRIQSSGQHLLRLINEVLDLSKIEAGKVNLHLESFSVNEMLQSIENTIAPLAEENDNTFTIESAPELGMMFSDLTKVRQCLLNLSSNACRFTNNGRIILRARRVEEPDRDWIEFAVEDTGKGLDEHELDKVFEAFVQVDDARTPDAGGTGLGLTITRTFCRMLGGSISVRSEPDEGSEFTMRLPARLPRRSHREAQETPPEIPVPAESAMAQQVEGRQTVLVIDDDLHARDLFSRVLTRNGWNVVTAASGSEGLVKAFEVKPDLITLDVLLPDMDGWAILTQLKNDEELMHTPVVMVSVLHEENLAYSLGASEFISKPVDPGRLRTVLETYKQRGKEGVVLVVEDEAPIREMIARQVRRLGWEAQEAADGAEALTHMRRHKPALVLLDLVMPVVDGFEFCRIVKADPALQDIPIVVLTALELNDTERNSLQSAVERILHKGTWSSKDLLGELERLLTANAATKRHEKEMGDE